MSWESLSVALQYFIIFICVWGLVSGSCSSNLHTYILYVLTLSFTGACQRDKATERVGAKERDCKYRLELNLHSLADMRQTAVIIKQHKIHTWMQIDLILPRRQLLIHPTQTPSVWQKIHNYCLLHLQLLLWVSLSDCCWWTAGIHVSDSFLSSGITELSCCNTDNWVYQCEITDASFPHMSNSVSVFYASITINCRSRHWFFFSSQLPHDDNNIVSPHPHYLHLF